MACVETFILSNVVIDNCNANDYIVCCCAKNEEKYIVDWCLHYFRLGFDKIFIGNNDDNQKTLPRAINKSKLLNENQKRSVIIQDMTKEHNFQSDLFTRFANQLSYKWALFIDCDEYLELNQHATIQDYTNDAPPECGSILINWMCYGTCGERQYKPIPLKNRFLKPKLPVDVDNDDYYKLTHGANINRHVKTLLKKQNDRIRFMTPHCTDLKTQMTNNFQEVQHCYEPNTLESWQFINYDYATIHHYYTKSLYEFKNKCKNRPDKAVTNNKEKKDLERLASFNYLQNDDMPTSLVIQCNFPIDNRIKNCTNILCLNKDKLVNLLKFGKKVTFVGDLTGNNKFINIAYYNNCRYIYKLPQYFKQNQAEFDIVVV